MVRLYRSPVEAQHWLVWLDESGWVRFPARINGWRDRCRARPVHRRNLRRVPLWLAFNTGLLEFLQRRELDRAA